MKFNFYCSKDESRYQVELTNQPKAVTCPKGHDAGVWSKGEVIRLCTVQNNTTLTISHMRVRHDQTTPNGKQIVVKHGKDIQVCCDLHKAEILKRLSKIGFKIQENAVTVTRTASTQISESKEKC